MVSDHSLLNTCHGPGTHLIFHPQNEGAASLFTHKKAELERLSILHTARGVVEGGSASDHGLLLPGAGVLGL